MHINQCYYFCLTVHVFPLIGNSMLWYFWHSGVDKKKKGFWWVYMRITNMVWYLVMINIMLTICLFLFALLGQAALNFSLCRENALFYDLLVIHNCKIIIIIITE